MFIITGLGNPGEKYQDNRHNAGFMFIDYLYNNSEVVKPWKYDKYSQSEISQVTFPMTDDRRLTTDLVKPQTYMNKSGDAVKKIISNQKSEISNLFVIHDDLDLVLSNFKIQKGVGPKVHNGISSIEDVLGSKDFWRVRIGVDNREDKKISGETYVLQNFTSEEKTTLETTFPKILERLISCLKAS